MINQITLFVLCVSIANSRQHLISEVLCDASASIRDYIQSECKNE